jgi:hypothetical protein
MNRIVVERRVSDDGVLELTLPLSQAQAGQTVRVTIELAAPKKPISPQEWQAGILATAGGWQGEFERPSEGAVEERELLS